MYPYNWTFFINRQPMARRFHPWLPAYRFKSHSINKTTSELQVAVLHHRVSNVWINANEHENWINYQTWMLTNSLISHCNMAVCCVRWNFISKDQKCSENTLLRMQFCWKIINRKCKNRISDVARLTFHKERTEIVFVLLHIVYWCRSLPSKFHYIVAFSMLFN